MIVRLCKEIYLFQKLEETFVSSQIPREQIAINTYLSVTLFRSGFADFFDIFPVFFIICRVILGTQSIFSAIVNQNYIISMFGAF